MTDADFNRLAQFGDRVALIDETGAAISYRDLAGRAESFAAKLGAQRRLVLIEASNELDAIVAYLGATLGRHCVILVGEDPGDGHRRIVEAFQPEFVYQRGALQASGAPPADLHPDVSVLLPTSGSTGSAKLVRLSRANLESNALAIAEYLEIAEDERAITSLPPHYSYGLSVINSHLAVGASLVLTDLSVTNPEFWNLVRQHGVTSIAGVPYSYELFERVGLRSDPPETLRVMTQAGGRLSPELVKIYAQFAASRGGRFYTMYGQTEAAPRMAYLPPAMAAANPDCVGVAIPGGGFHLIGDDGREIQAAETTGELVYRGPNVMMGYAFAREDLARGAEVDELRTGDLAVRTRQGLYKIVGRASRFVKIAGLRIGLDDVETLLADAGTKAVAAGRDGRVAILVLGGASAQDAREYVARRCGLPVAAVFAVAGEEEPRLPSGKVDYRAILAQADRVAEHEAAAADTARPIAAAYARALGIAPPPGEATFASLGGDSLSYVNASIGVERALGQLPVGWETMTVASLDAMIPEGPVRRSRYAAVDSEMVVRISALGLVAAGHAAPAVTETWLRGGSAVLFALAGFNLARFQGESLRAGRVRPAITGTLYRVIAPYLVLMAVLLPVSEADKSIAWPLLLSVFTVEFRGPLFSFWFIESVFHALLITCALFLVPPLRRVARERPFATALGLVAAATAFKYLLPLLWNDGRDIHLTVDAWLYCYFIGWSAYVAQTRAQRITVVALAAVLASLDYGLPSSRAFWLTAGLAVVLFVPRITLPRGAASTVLALAGASYFIYLVHSLVVHFVVLTGHFSPSPFFNIPVVLVASAVLGLGYAMIWNAVAPRILSLITLRGVARQGA
jgi:acyl-CoA synthetase (AMP-forming)/AMP-acid ligase II